MKFHLNQVIGMLRGRQHAHQQTLADEFGLFQDACNWHTSPPLFKPKGKEERDKLMLVAKLHVFSSYLDKPIGIVKIDDNHIIAIAPMSKVASPIRFNNLNETLLRLKKDVNRTLVNYRIQIYNGNRQGAKKAETDFKEVFSDWNPSMKFQTPNYKIWVGSFKTRLEADRALLRIKKEFRNAFIINLKN